jgi:tetratricopeptide (TPR) repeat protein
MRSRRFRRYVVSGAAWGLGLGSACILLLLFAASHSVAVRGWLWPMRARLFVWGHWVGIHLLKFAVSRWHWIQPSLTPLGVLLIALCALLGYYIVTELRRSVTIIEPFSVPKQFEDAGITPRVMASRIGSALEALEQSIQTAIGSRDSFGYSHLEVATPDIEIPQTKMGLKAAIEFFRGFLKLHITRISGDVIFVDDGAVPVSPSKHSRLFSPNSSSRRAALVPAKQTITVTVYGAKGREQRPGIKAAIDSTDVNEVVRQAAEISLEFANPYLFGRLLSDRGENSRAIDVAMKMTEGPIRRFVGRSKDQEMKRNGHYLWGYALAETGKSPEAIEQYKRALVIDPDFGFVYTVWGLALHAQEHYEDAIVKYKKALELDPKYVFAYQGWGWVLHRQKKYEDAATSYKAALKLRPNDANTHASLGDSLRNSGDYEGAIASYREAFRLDPQNVLAYFYCSASLRHLGRTAEADAMSARAKKLHSSS